MRTLRKTGSAAAPHRRLLPLLGWSLAALCLAWGGSAAAGEVDFYAVLDKQEMGIDDSLTLTVTISADAGRLNEESLRLPDSQDFHVESRSQSTQMSFDMRPGAPSSFRQVRVITMLLAPKKLGTFTFTPGRLVVRGKAYETGALQVRVVQGGGQAAPSRPQANRPPANPFAGLGDDDADALSQLFGGERPAADSDLYLRAVIDKRQPFVGEQVTLSTYLFARVGAEVSGVDNPKMPKLDGFWAEDLESPRTLEGELKVIDGVNYRVFLVRRQALFPLRSGKLTIDPMELDISTGMGFGFGFGALSGRKVHRAAPALALEVQPLPANPPAGFDGTSVGQWHLSAEATPSQVKLGEPVMLKVILEGTGNLHGAGLVRLPPIHGFKTYDPTSTEKGAANKKVFGGKRTLEYLLMPEQTGTFEIPGLRFVYFDPAQRQYQVAQTDPISVRAEAGSGPTVASGGGAVGAAERAVNVLGGTGLRPLRYKGELTPAAAPLYLRPFFWPAASAPVLLWALGLVYSAGRAALRQSDPNSRQRSAGARARKRLRKAQQLLEQSQPDAFYAEVSRALHDYLGDKLGSPVLGLTRAELTARLQAAGLAEDCGRELAAVLDTCDAGRFSPGGSGNAAMEKLWQRALALMDAVEAARLSKEVRP